MFIQRKLNNRQTVLVKLANQGTWFANLLAFRSNRWYIIFRTNIKGSVSFIYKMEDVWFEKFG